MPESCLVGREITSYPLNVDALTPLSADVLLFIGPIPLIEQVQLEEEEIRESGHGKSPPGFRCHETQ